VSKFGHSCLAGNPRQTRAGQARNSAAQAMLPAVDFVMFRARNITEIAGQGRPGQVYAAINRIRPMSRQARAL
jgi:hypothetical protein